MMSFFWNFVAAASTFAAWVSFLAIFSPSADDDQVRDASALFFLFAAVAALAWHL